VTAALAGLPPGEPVDHGPPNPASDQRRRVDRQEAIPKHVHVEELRCHIARDPCGLFAAPNPLLLLVQGGRDETEGSCRSAREISRQSATSVALQFNEDLPVRAG
jgi:hypothetical protein